MTDPTAPKNQLRPLRALSLAEIELIAADLQTLVGAQVQECEQSESACGLGFYHEREIFWLWFDLQPQQPLVLRFHNKPPAHKKWVGPFTLFVRSRFLGRRLKAVRAASEVGRVLIFTFHRAANEEEQGSCEIEARLFLHGQNLIARDGKKSVAIEKPRDIPLSAAPAESEPARAWREVEAAWHAQRQPRAKSEGGAEPLLKAHLRAIEKKEKALERMREDLRDKLSDRHARLGEWLKMHLTLEVPEEFRDLIDLKATVIENMAVSFQRAKDGQRKAAGSLARIAAVEAEVAALKRDGPSTKAPPTGVVAGKGAKSLLEAAAARGRRHHLTEDLDVYIGKSASDNLALLRRAQPFDLWLHLSDVPGSHAIIRRARSRIVSDQELTTAARWVIEQSLGKHGAELQGERHDVLITECRFVRPIKGDKLGRVNYSHERILRVRM